MLESDVINAADVAYFAATYIFPENEDISNEEAYELVEQKIGLSKLSSNNTTLTYADFTYMCSKIWNVKTSIMSKILGSPRYAFKDLQGLGYLPKGKTPSDYVSGFDALTIITHCITYSELHSTISLEDLREEEVEVTIPALSR